mmetsp:Transcript_36564/g.77795  ORF Transcript_36564/g.77795 Transcript_36564/m.77795 type:complete len:274 (+) Transcript_36564:119-940(+)
MERIPFIGCINLLERDDRYKMIGDEFKRIGVTEKVYWHRPNKHPKGGRYGCFESHLAVFQAALDKNVPWAVVIEDDVRFASSYESSFKSLLQLVDSGIEWNHASLQNSGGEVCLEQPEDKERLPSGIFRGAFYFTRCYAITREAMQVALKTGITSAHVDVALAVSNWGKGFIVRPAAVLDVPSESDNDWAEGGWGPWMAGKMQGVTHLPCVIADRWKTGVLPSIMSGPSMEAVAWKKFMSEPGAKDHLQEGVGPKPAADGTRNNRACGCFGWS